MNKCIICGKEYEPYHCYGKRQMTCSPECRKEYARIYAKNHPKRYEYAERCKQLARERRNGHVICRICGKPVYRTFAVGEGSPWMHYECVINDCIKTIRQGEKLSKKQVMRLDTRGYTPAEFIEEYAEEIYNGKTAFCDKS